MVVQIPFPQGLLLLGHIRVVLRNNIITHTSRNVKVEMCSFYILHDLSEVSEGEGGVCGWEGTIINILSMRWVM